MKATVTVGGLEKLGMRADRRANFLGGDAMQRLCENFGRSAVLEMRSNIASFTPGTVEDLTEKYKKQKARRWGHVYPILLAGGELFRSIYSKVRREGGAFIIAIAFKGTHTGGISNARLAEIHINGSEGRGGRIASAKATLKDAKTARRLLNSNRTRTAAKSAKEALTGAHRGLPARDFTQLSKTTEAEWLRRISAALRSLK